MIKIKYSKDLCNGCGLCVKICPINKDVLLNKNEPIGRIFKIVNGVMDLIGLCQQCKPAPCMEICPARAIRRNEQDIVIIDQFECNVCGLCSVVCSNNAIFIDLKKEKWSAIKCELCSGDPLCVKNCPTGALLYEEV